jgi:hypothetical protein
MQAVSRGSPRAQGMVVSLAGYERVYGGAMQKRLAALDTAVGAR